MGAFVRAELRARRRMILALTGGAFSILLIVALAYEPLGLHAFGSAFGGAPRLLEAFSGSRNTNLLSPHGWMSFGFNHPIFVVTTLTVAIAIGSGAIAGEIETGRAELLFTRPVPRTRFLFAQVRVWAIAQTVVLAGALLGAVLGSLTSDRLRSAGLAELVLPLLQYIPLAAFYAAVAFAASAWTRTRGHAAGVAIGLAVFGYLLSVISGLIPSLDWLRWLSPFGYYQPGTAIDDGIRVWPALALLAAAAALFAATVARFNRRDLA